MTVANVNAYSDPVNTGGVETDYSFDFPIDEGAESSVLVQLTDADGAITYPEYITDYTVTRATEPTVGGVVNLVAEPSSGSSLVAYRSTALTQARQLPNQGPFLAATVEAMADKLTLLAQEIKRDQDLTLSLPLGTDTSAVSLVMPIPVAGRSLVGVSENGVTRYSNDGLSQETLEAATTAAVADATASATASAATATTKASEASADAATATTKASEASADAASAASDAATATTKAAEAVVAAASVGVIGALASLDTVDTAQIEANAVTLAELEHGTSGDVLYYGASGEPFRLAKGTDGEVLKLENGLPAWADGKQIMIMRDEKPSGTASGTFTTGAQRTRELNTIVHNSIAGASLLTNQVTLAAGTYRFRGLAPGHRVDEHRALLYNVTDATVEEYGTSERSYNAIYNPSTSEVVCVVTIASTKVFELRHECARTYATNGFGWDHSMGTNVYAQLEIEKVA